MTNIRIVGVPEHFNLPWHLCIKDQSFDHEGIKVIWQDVPEGTGKMCEMLKQDETDVAIILTEGIVKDIQKGNDSKIIQKYVESPLIWGVHVCGESKYNNTDEILPKHFAISRLGSGSHLMSYVYANQKKWLNDELSFEIVNNIQGAAEALKNKKANLFLWEKFMTKPLVDNGLMKRLDECPTPWPCFSIAVRTDFLEKNKPVIKSLLRIINQKTLLFKDIPNIIGIISEKYQLKKNDVKLWLKDTEWSQENFTKKQFNKIQADLLNYHVIEQKSKFQDIVINV
jgi:ABC-type nitrate/sulfonate/bicarbonate transport system substrate-binding protein